MKPVQRSESKFLKYFHTKLNPKVEEPIRKRTVNPECEQRIQKLQKSMVSHLQTHILFIEKKLKEKNQAVDKLENQLYAANQRILQQTAAHERVTKKMKIQIKSLERVVEEWEARSIKWKINQVEDTVRIEKLAFLRFQSWKESWKEKNKSIGKEIVIKEDPQELTNDEGVGMTECSIAADIKSSPIHIVDSFEDNTTQQMQKIDQNNFPKINLSFQEVFSLKIDGQISEKPNSIDIQTFILQKNQLQEQIKFKNTALKERQDQIANILMKLRQDQQKLLHLTQNLNNQQQIINSFHENDKINIHQIPKSVSFHQQQQTEKFNNIDFQMQTDQQKKYEEKQTETKRINLSHIMIQTQILNNEQKFQEEEKDDLKNENNDLKNKIQEMEKQRQRMLSFIQELQQERQSRDVEQFQKNQTSQMQQSKDEQFYQKDDQQFTHKDQFNRIQNEKLNEMHAELTHYKSTLQSLLSEYTLYRQQSQSQAESLSNDLQLTQQQLQEKNEQWQNRQDELMKEIQDAKQRQQQLQQSIYALQQELQSVKYMQDHQRLSCENHNEQVEPEQSY